MSEGGLSPGLPENDNTRTFLRSRRKSLDCSSCKFLVSLLIVNTMGSLYRSRVTANSPPGVLKSSTGLLYFHELALLLL